MNRLFLLLRLIAATGLFVLVSCGGDEAAVEAVEPSEPDVVRLSEAQIRAAGIRTEVVEPSTIRRQTEVPASVHPPDPAHAVIGSIVEGRVTAVHVLPGDVVRRGQPLVEIHTHELADAQSELAAARAELEFRANAFSRSEQLYSAGAVPLEEVERRRADLEAARAHLQRTEEIIEHLVPSAEGHSTAVASRDGTVFQVHARVGQAVLSGAPIVEVGVTDVLWVTAFVPEQTASMLAPGDSVEVRFGGQDQAAWARLIRAGNYVDPTNRSVEMRFELTSIPPGVRPGSFAVVSVTTSDAFEGLELGDDAAVRLGDRDVVFVVEGPGVYRAIDVEAASTRDRHVAVRGVPAGAEIVVEGAYFLKAALELAGEAEEDAGGGA
jgi:cobalt-zinc-cadmium efflux system membrane fusion protein